MHSRVIQRFIPTKHLLLISELQNEDQASSTRQQRMKRYIYIPLHGGLGDQIKKLYAGILVGRELKVSKILIDFSFLGDYHIGEATALKSILSTHKNFQICKRDLPLDRFREKLLGFLTRFRKKFPRLVNKLVNFSNFVLGYFTDLEPYSYDTISYSKVIKRLKYFRFHRKVIISGYFASVDYFFSLDANDQRIIKVPDKKLSQMEIYAVMHFRVGDIFTKYKSFGILDEGYYQQALEVIQNSYGPIEVFGISDDVKRAGVLFSNLKITWVTSSDTWNADEALSAMASAPILVASNSGLALFGGLLSIHPNPSIFFPKVPNNEHWRPHSNEILSQRWNLVSASLWYPET